MPHNKYYVCHQEMLEAADSYNNANWNYQNCNKLQCWSGNVEIQSEIHQFP